MVPRPANKHRIIKKRTARFVRNQSDRFKRVDGSWRKPRGIDSPMRRQDKGQRPIVRVGYGSDKRTRHLHPSGFYKVRVFNVRDLEPFLLQNRTFAAEIASGVSFRKRAQIIERARQLNIKVLNRYARSETEEQ